MTAKIAQVRRRSSRVSGAAAGRDRAVCVTLGTGVGSSFLHDGRPVTDGPTVPPEGRAHRITVDGLPLEDVVSRRAIRARHAEAAHVELSLTAEQDTVVLRVSDNGRGTRGAREGAGIRGMRERALLVGADLSIAERPGGGTEVRLAVPVRGDRG